MKNYSVFTVKGLDETEKVTNWSTYAEKLLTQHFDLWEMVRSCLATVYSLPDDFTLQWGLC